MTANQFQIHAIDHLQIAIPPGQEVAGREFYAGLLGFTEVPKPENLAGRGGAWFVQGTLKLHLGIDADFHPARKAHPAFQVANLPALVTRLAAAGVTIERDQPLPGFDRVHVFDPFGNRVELLEPQTVHPPSLELRVSDQHLLRLATVNDACELFRMIDTSRAYLRQWLPWIDATQSVDDVRRYIETRLQHAANHHGNYMVICDRGQIVGVTGFLAIDWSHRITVIGYWLAELYQGQGLMTNSCRALIRHAFTTWGLNRIVIRCATGNLRSQAIPCRLGFTREGTEREAEWLYDHYVDLINYSLLRSEWNAANMPDPNAADK